MSSRVEELLAATVDGSGTDGLDPPQSRNEKLLFALNDKLDNVKSALAGKVDGPADGQAYQQLVTDADGNTQWEDRLAYEVPEQWKLFTLEDASELAAYCTKEAYDAGKTFRVVIDGQVFDDVPVVEYYSAGRAYGIGEPINDSNPVWSDDGYGFLIRAMLTVAYNPDKFSSKPKVFTDTFVYELVSPSNIKQIDPKFLPVMDSVILNSSSGGTPYQQLVTDGDGNAKWEDRLAYEGTKWNDFVLDPSTTFPTEITGFTMPPAGDTVRIKVNGVESVETVVHCSMNTFHGRYIGSYAPPSVAAGAPGWCIFCLDGEEEVDGRTNVPMTISLLLPEVHKIDQKYVPKEVYFVKFDGRSLDKTFDEITEAYNAGMLVVLDGSGMHGLMSYIDSERLEFVGIDANASTTIILTSDNTISQINNVSFTMDDNGTFTNRLILPSSTSGSSKRFDITVDDTGTISATEVT